MLEVTVFGRVRARRDGVELDLGGPRQRAVLGMLVAAGRRTVSADRFLEELWSGEPPPSAAGALQVYVSRLRSVLEPERARRRPATVLVSVPPGYALSLPTTAVDAWHLSEVVAGAAAQPDVEALDALDRALALWVDEPYTGHADQEWAATEVARLEQLRGDAVELRAAAALRLGRGTREIADLEAHVVRHPLREQAVGLLARCCYQAGRQAEALAALAALRTRLVEELGVDPGPETRELEQDVLRQAEHLAPPRPAPTTVELPEAAISVAVRPVVAATTGPALLGREDELARLGAAAARLGRRAGVVWVEGEAGVGKSALVGGFADGCVDSWSVVRGQCAEVDGAPAGHVWRELLAGLDAAGPQGSGASPFALADAVRRRLEARATPTLLLVEDVHRADDQTLQVLWHVVESTRAPVLVVCTLRADEVGRDLATTLALTAEHTLESLALGGLDDTAARDLLEHYLDHQLGGGLDPATASRLVERAAGNPLFLRQLAQLVRAEGPASAERLPAAIREVLLRRIERLAAATADTLSRASVLGRDLDLDLVAALEQAWGGVDEETAADHLDAGLVAGLLDDPRPAELRFVHALVRDTFYSRLPPLRRTRLHRVALEVLQRLRPGAIDEIAHHATVSLDRGSAGAAVPVLLAAARRGGPAAAARHLRTALRALELADSPPEDAFEVRLDLVRALARDGDARAANAERALAVAAATAHGTLRDVVRAWQWQSPIMWSRRITDTAEPATIRELRHLLAQLPRDEVALRVELLNAVVIEADPWNIAEVVAASDEAVALAERVGDPELLCRALNSRFFGVLADPDPRATLALGRRLLAVAEGADLHGYAAVAHMFLQSAAVGDADLGTAGAHIEEAVRTGTSGQVPELLLLSTIFEATTLLLQSEVERARSAFDDVCRLLDELGDPNTAAIRLWSRFAVEFAAGDTSPLVDEARAMARAMPWHHTDLLVAALVDAGDLDAARAAWRPEVVLERDATWLFDAAVRAWIAHRLDDTAQARVLHDQLAPWSGQLARSLNGALAMGPVDYFLGLLATTLGEPAAAARHHERAGRITGPGQATTWDRTWVRTPTHLRRR